MSTSAVLESRGLDWRSLRKHIGVTHEDILVLTGSTALPFPTAGSDVDVFILCHDSLAPDWFRRRSLERLPEQEANGFLLAYLALPDAEVDLEIWPISRVDRAIRDFGSGIAGISVIEQNFSRLAGLERKVGLDLFHAIFAGAADPDSEQRLGELRSTIDWARFLAWNRDYHLINASDGIKGSLRSLADGHPQEAYLKACWAADNLVDGIIFHSGHSISRWKWRLRYLSMVDSRVADLYRAVRFGPVCESDGNLRTLLLAIKDLIDESFGKRPRIPPHLA